MPHRFEPEGLGHLDSKLRYLALPPRRTLGRLGLKQGDTFLDIGAGSGFFALPAARIVGDDGRVLAVDVAPEAVELIKRKKEAAGLGNVEAVLSEAGDLASLRGVATLAFMSLVLHEIEDKAGTLGSIRRALADGGRIAIIEFRKSPLVLGPPAGERIGRPEMAALLHGAGFGG